MRGGTERTAGSAALATNGTVAFVSTRTGRHTDLFVVLVDGSGETGYTTDPANDELPSWQAR